MLVIGLYLVLLCGLHLLGYFLHFGLLGGGSWTQKMGHQRMKNKSLSLLGPNMKLFTLPKINYDFRQFTGS